jgi:gluconolactonase
MCKSLLTLPSSISPASQTDNFLNSWNPSGVLIGQFAVSGGSNNFAFVPGGMYIFNANKLFKVTIKAEGRVVKRDFGLGGQKAYP